MKHLVSVIITTKNEEKNIANCLQSVVAQTYKEIEIIVVDNNSSDNTQKIAKTYTKNVITKGPERSAQRNYGAKISHGDYFLFVDADMQLSQNVVKECVELCESSNTGAVVIPEKSVGNSFWAHAKALERSYYTGNHSIEAARFYKKTVFNEMSGFDELLTGPEDWDLSKRVEEKYAIADAKNYIIHNEGNLSFTETVKTKYYYSKKMKGYMKKRYLNQSAKSEANPLLRFILFFSSPRKLFKNPLLGIGMLFMKACEYGAGLVGFIFSK